MNDEWHIKMIGDDRTIDGYAGYDGRMRGLSKDVAFRLAMSGIYVLCSVANTRRFMRR